MYSLKSRRKDTANTRQARTVTVDVKLLEKMRKFAAKTNVTISSVANVAISEWIANQKKEPNE